MRKIIFLTLVLVFLAPVVSFASSLGEILGNPAKFDAKKVEIEAEAIGSPLKGDGGVWINVGSRESNIGIFSKDSGVLERIKYWGSYREKGDYLRIEGVFFRNCPFHQISDIHLESLEVVETGYENKISVSPEKVKLAAILFVICLIMGAIYFIKRFLERPKNL